MSDCYGFLRRVFGLAAPIFPRRSFDSVRDQLELVTRRAAGSLQHDVPAPVKAVQLYDSLLSQGYCHAAPSACGRESLSFPTEVLFQKYGNCLGFGLLYLIAAWELGIPMVGAMSKGHFFPALWAHDRYWRPERFARRGTALEPVYQKGNAAYLESYSRAAIVPLTTEQMEADLLVARAVTCRAASGDFQGARSDLLQALELWPSHPLVKANLKLSLCLEIRDHCEHVWTRFPG